MPTGRRFPSLDQDDEIEDRYEGIDVGSPRGPRSAIPASIIEGRLDDRHQIEAVEALRREMISQSNGIAELKAMISSVLQMTSGMALKMAGDKTAKSGDLERVSLATQVLAVEEIFKFEFVRSASAAALAQYVLSVCKGPNSLREDSENGLSLRIISVFFFSTQSAEKKSLKKLTDAGKAHSQLRGMIVRILRNELPGRKETLEMRFAALAAASRSSAHAPHSTSGTPTLNSTSEDGSITQSAWVAPVWMTEGYLKREMIESVRYSVDGLEGGEPRGKKRKKPGNESPREKIAREVLKAVFAKVSDQFNRGRDAARRTLLMQLGYILRDPTTEPASEVTWISRNAPVLDDIMDVPSLHPLEGALFSEQDTATNRDIYAKFVASRLEMVFKVTYYVTVKREPGDPPPNPNEPKEKPLTTSVGLLDCALNTCVALLRYQVGEEVFLSSPNALRMVYVIALGFRSIVQKYEEYVSMSESDRPPWDQFEMLWSMLVPGKVVREKLLQEGTLHMDRGKYQALLDQNSPERDIPSYSSGNEESDDDEEDDDLDGVVLRI